MIALLIVAFGAEIVLYLMRYSSLANTVYNAIMVGSFFVGLKIHPLIADQTVPKPTKQQVTLKFAAAFLLFFMGSTVINYYSTYVFNDFNDQYESYVEESAAAVQSYSNPDSETGDKNYSIFDTIDSVGYDLYTDSLAGLEEVWRLSYMIIFLSICKKLFPNRWSTGKRDIFLLLALFITSVVFGIDHTLNAEQPWPIKIGSIVTFANMGFLFGVILLWTRNLWLTVLVHSVYDIAATLSWYYYDYAVEAFAGIVLAVFVILKIFEKKQSKQRIAPGEHEQNQDSELLQLGK